MNWHKKHKAGLSLVERVEERIAAFCATRTFFLLHVVWFGFWVLKPVEPFPYGFLTMVVSLEAILLSTIIMINQRRHDAVAAAHAEDEARVEREKLDTILRNLRGVVEYLPSVGDTGADFEYMRRATSEEALGVVAVRAAQVAITSVGRSTKRKAKRQRSKARR